MDYPLGDGTNNYDDKKPYIVKVKTEFDVTPNLLVATNEKSQEVDRQLGHKDAYRQRILNQIYHVDDVLIFPGDSCFVNMCNSKRCDKFHTLFGCFGCGPMHLNIYGLFLNRATIFTKRSLSDTDEYPNHAYEPDPSYSNIGESVPLADRPSPSST